MTNILLFSDQPVLVAGLQAVLEAQESLTLASVCANTAQLMERVQTERPDIILLEFTEAITLETLEALKSVGVYAPIILWADLIPIDFVTQVMGLGVRGILRKNLPVDLQVKCFQKVAAGELWIEKALSDKVLSSRRATLTRRERHIACLVAQGMKNKEVAYSIGITEGTVKVYLSRLFHKIGVRDRFELALFALENLDIHQPTSMSSKSAARRDPFAAIPPMSPGILNRAPVTLPLPALAGNPSNLTVRDMPRRAS